MSDPIAPVASRPSLQAPSPQPRPEGARAFSEVLEAAPEAPTSSPLGEALRGAAQSISRGERLVDGAIRGVRGEVDPARLLALQAGVYRYTQELELTSKLVDKATGAVKQVLQSQQ